RTVWPTTRGAERVARDVRARPSDTVDVTKRDRVVVNRYHDNRDRSGSSLGGTSCGIGGCDDYVHVETDQVGSQVGQPIDLSFGVSVLNDDILAVDVAQFAQSLLKGREVGR